MALVYEDLYLFSQENRIPYDLQLFETDLTILFMVYQLCCEFYELNLIRLFLGTMVLVLRLQKIRNLCPSNPFYDYNSHQ